MELTPRLRLMNWLVRQGLTGLPENDLLRGFCERCRAAGMPLSRAIGITAPRTCPDLTFAGALFTTTCDWRVASLGWMYTLFFVLLGVSAAIWGGWLEKAGPRKAGFVAALCWAGGLVIGALGRCGRGAVDCLQKSGLAPEEIERFELRRFQPEGEIVLYRPGPSAAAPTGYLGRTTIVEFLVMNDALRRAVMRHAGMGELEQLARESGMRTMYEDGILKALRGETTIEEVIRAIGAAGEADSLAAPDPVPVLPLDMDA